MHTTCNALTYLAGVLGTGVLLLPTDAAAVVGVPPAPDAGLAGVPASAAAPLRGLSAFPLQCGAGAAPFATAAPAAPAPLLADMVAAVSQHGVPFLLALQASTPIEVHNPQRCSHALANAVRADTRQKHTAHDATVEAADVVPLGQRGHKYCDDMSKTCCSLPKWWRLTEVAPWASYRWSISVLILIAALVPHVLCVAPAVRHCGCSVCKCFPHDTNYFCQSHHLSFRRLLSCALRLAVQLANAARRAVVPLAIVKYLLRCNLDAVAAACLGVQRR